MLICILYVRFPSPCESAAVAASAKSDVDHHHQFAVAKHFAGQAAVQDVALAGWTNEKCKAKRYIFNRPKISKM